MSAENVEIVRRAFAALNKGDLDDTVADIAPQFEYVASGMMPDRRGVFRGIEEWKSLISWVPDVFDEAQVEATELVDAGDKVLTTVLFSGRGKQSGVETNWTLWQVWTLAEGKVVHAQGFTSREEALKAAGLPEDDASSSSS